ncbi:MAG: DUF6444 domain-containing protein [Actinobacteria bacterium]|nr:DUF6444 domain-containing protein [Actinomycetota bacterium]MCL5446616.1 DUF6444 domain-containing protein [Actinomycetota bacterium]
MTDERDLRIVELEADNAALRQEVERLSRRIVELEKKSGRNSQNSSMPPSSDTGGESCKVEPDRVGRGHDRFAYRDETRR